MDWTPAEGKLVVKIDEPPSSAVTLLEETRSGMRPHTGVVVALGAGDSLQGLLVGMQVLFTPFSGIEFDLNGELHRVMRPEDVLLRAPGDSALSAPVEMGEWLIEPESEASDE